MNNDKKKTIAIVTPYFPPQGGGLERYAFEIAKRLKSEHDWRIIVITTALQGDRDSKEAFEGFTVYRLSYRFKISNTPVSFGWFGKIRAILKEENPDLLHIHTPVPGIGNMAALLAGSIPVVVTYHTGHLRKGSPLLDIFAYAYEMLVLPFMLARANSIVGVSDFVYAGILKKYQYKSSVITPAVDPAIFYPDVTKKTPKQTLLFVAGLNRSDQYKGLRGLIDAVLALKPQFPNLQLLVIGEGNMKNEYIQYVSDMGLADTVLFRGRLTGAELTQVYQGADIFVLPSLYESFGMAILEAMACALPVVSTKVGGIPSLVEEGKTGFLVEPKNNTMLVEKISLLLSNPSLAAEFGKQGYIKAAEGYNWKVQTQKYDALFKQYMPGGARKLRILETPVRFYPYIGGVENQIYYFSEQLVKLGYTVEVLCANEPPGVPNEIVKGFRVRRLSYAFKIANTNITLGLPWALWRTNTDVIHTHMPTPWSADWSALISKLKGKPLVLTIHNDMDKADSFGKVLIWIYVNTFFRLLLKRASKIIIVNTEWRTSFTQTRDIFEQYAEKILSIPNGVDVDLFHPAVKKVNNSSILFVSVLDEHHRFKGFNYLLKAMVDIKKEIPTIKLIVVGDGQLLKEYKEMATELDLNDSVEFHGKKNQQELVTYYQNTNAFVLPSIEIEGMPLVLLEAMSSGLPVVTTNVTGMASEIATYKAGLVIPPRDPKKLSDAITQLLKDDNLKEKMGINARNLAVEKYSWKMLAQKLADLFEEIAV